MEAINIENLNFSYPKKQEKSLDNINFVINEGEFILICGQTGCGKSTLLKQLKPELTPFGESCGKILYYGKDLRNCDFTTTSKEIGYVLQNPDAQIVTDKVWHELAFGLENMGLDTPTIRRRVAEMASFFGIQSWFRKNITELSGGQKQLLNLASIMVMQPKILILDEPTSQLDPIASNDFVDTLVRINRELGTTIIITEHNLEEIFPIADRVLVMDNAQLLCFDTPVNVVNILSGDEKNYKMFKALPTPAKVYTNINAIYSTNGKCPLTVREGKKWIKDNFNNKNYINNEIAVDREEKGLKKIKFNFKKDKNIVVELKDVWFQYEKGGDVIVRNASLKVYKGEMYAILGGNGTGKTTTLSIIANQNKALRGKVLINNIDIKKYKNNKLYEDNLSFLCQNPQSMFVFDTLREDLEEGLRIKKMPKDEIKERVDEVAKDFNIQHLLNQHPYDLSGGEMQRAGMAKVMLLNPKILLLDEPTKGLDAHSKEEIANILFKLKGKGVTIILVTHDIEFGAMYCDRCAMFFDGSIVSEGEPLKFFSGNNFYTTVANRMSRDTFKGALTCEDVIDLCKANIKTSRNF
jgi:energy-coupling factor transport system ATP-binding protein